ncbi:FAFL131Wp [Eremothecium gossypii FDAG1]|nr:FAFL131Wp [Eremothecium gossypii FDAG1]
MAPKKFKTLDSFMEEQGPDPSLTPSPFGGYFSKADAGQGGRRDWNKGAARPGGQGGYQAGYAGYGYGGYGGYQAGYQAGYGGQGYQAQGYQAQGYGYQAPQGGRAPQGAGVASPPAGITPSGSAVSLTSLTNSLSGMELTPLSKHVEALAGAGSIAEVRRCVADATAEFDGEGAGARDIVGWDVAGVISKLLRPKNPALLREGAMLLISAIAARFSGHGVDECHLLQLLPLALDGLAEKDATVKREAQHAVNAIYGAFPTEALAPAVLPALLSYLVSGAKWQSKLGALKLVDNVREDSPSDMLEMKFKESVPVLTDLATDFKPELAKQGYATLLAFVSILDNLDLQPRFKLIVDTLQNPKLVPDSVKSLSSVTFVAEVTEPALALLCPILNRSLNLSSSSQEQLRQTVIVIENLTRLVNNRIEIESFIPQLLPGVKKVYQTATMPEVRELAEKALQVLEEDESKDSKSFPGKITDEEGLEFLEGALKKLGQSPLEDAEANKESIEYLGKVLTALANANDWKTLEKLLLKVLGDEHAEAIEQHFIRDLRLIFHQERAASGDDEGVEIVNTDFSLAYGSRMLLNKTTLRLLKGHRYGLCGRNGAGKSTLMRSISNGQLEGFPSQDELKTCFVERALEGEDGSVDIVSFLASAPSLENTPRKEIVAALESVGFDADRRAQTVGSLSGGWKMKLELTRAILQKADILLLDEPTNHLDVANVRWLEEYLLNNTEITSLIVSHDTGFLDKVCTDIIHYENKKLAYYKGNLHDFVEQKPEAKSYYTLTDSNAQMHFPAPGILSGVKSNTRAVAKMTDVTFTYPGAPKPSMADVSCSLSLSSRVAIIGPNGAGKSTLIKLLTGELVPTSGKVEKHPNLRIGYIAQHALQHVNEHKEKTANQYLQWRYRFGDDREVLLKESRKISSEEEMKMMETEIDIGDGRGKRAVEAIVGRQKLKKSFQYEIKWKWWKPKYNSWVPKEVLVEHGFEKLVQKFDDHEASREGLGYRELVPSVITKHFEDIGLDAEIANHTPLGSLSGGQLVKVVIAGAMWNNPHLLVLDEPTNYLDRDSLGALAMAIREWTGGVVMISHSTEFVGALCPEQWIVENGTMVQKGVVTVDQSRFADGGNAEAVGLNITKTVVDDDSPANIKVRQRKKRMTRNEKKAQAERRRLRYLEWLSSPKGTPKPVDTDDEASDSE